MRVIHYRAVLKRRLAFTLIEIMVVVAIIGIVMAAGAPTLHKALNKEGFRKTVSDGCCFSSSATHVRSFRWRNGQHLGALREV
jgi:prepilin-type N-terminal cleavage/methylation domain-containing protein